MAVIVIVEDGIIEIIEWRWDVRKDTLVFVKMRSMPGSKPKSLEACSILC